MRFIQKIILISVTLALVACKDRRPQEQGSGNCKDCNYPSVPHHFSGEDYLTIPKQNQAMLSKNNQYALPYLFSKQTSENKWVVFSDRADNITYKEPCGNTVYKNSIGYMEVFLVADSCGNRLRIVKENDLVNVDGEFSSNAQDYGWIPKDRLLCWQNSIKSQETRALLKVLTINTIESAQKKITDVERVRFFQDPALQNETGSTTPMYRTYYLYKRDGDAFLVGTKPDITAYNAKDYIKGWVDKSRFIIWENRLALEQNWENASERKNSNVKAKFFTDKFMAEKYQKGESTESRMTVWSEQNISSSRMKGNRFRFPVFSFEENTNIVYAGVVGNVLSKSGSDIDGEALDFREKTEDIKRSIKNINILFVLDCTQSMSEYIPRVAQAISNKIRFLSEEATNNIKFSVLGYRDRISGYGDSKTLENPGFQFTDDYRQVERFLRSIQTYNTENGHAEQMYRGLEEAMKYNRLSSKADDTNIVVLVGDAGNSRYADKQQLVNLFATANCNFLAFQIGHRNNIVEDGVNPYDEFIEQIKSIALQSANKRAEMIEAKYGKSFSPQFAQQNGIYRLTNTPLRCEIYESPKGGSQSAADLENAIGEIVKSAEEFGTEVSDKFDRGGREGLNEEDFNIESSNKVFGGSLAPVIWNILAQRGIDKNTIENLMLTEKYQLLFPSYSTLKHINIRGNLYKYCLFIQKRDLSDLITNITTLTYETDKRKGLYDAYMKLLSNQVGEDIAKNYKSPKEITYLLFGIPSQCRIFDGISNMEYLLDPYKISDSAINEYWQHIGQSLNKLQAILNNNEDCPKMQIDNDVFYWIPQDYLP